MKKILLLTFISFPLFAEDSGWEVDLDLIGVIGFDIILASISIAGITMLMKSFKRFM